MLREVRISRPGQPLRRVSLGRARAEFLGDDSWERADSRECSVSAWSGSFLRALWSARSVGFGRRSGSAQGSGKKNLQDGKRGQSHWGWRNGRGCAGSEVDIDAAASGAQKSFAFTLCRATEARAKRFQRGRGSAHPRRMSRPRWPTRAVGAKAAQESLSLFS